MATKEGNVSCQKQLCCLDVDFFMKTIGDHQPDNNTIHLPSCFSKINVYKRKPEEKSTFGQPTTSVSHLYSLWDMHFRHVVIPQVLLPIKYFIFRMMFSNFRPCVIPLSIIFFVLSWSILMSLLNIADREINNVP